MKEELKMIEYLTSKRKEVKKLVENDEENINNFMISEKINLTKEKSKNIKNMKKIILEHPDIFVQSAFFSKELKNNIEETEHIFRSIYSNYEHISNLFKDEIDSNELNNLKHVFELKDVSFSILKEYNLEDIFKLPLIIHKNNEKQNLQECVKYIKIGATVRQLLHHWYHTNAEKDKDQELDNNKKKQHNTFFFQSYEKCLNEEVEKAKNTVYTFIRKTENVDTLKNLLLYLQEIINYYNCFEWENQKNTSTKEKEIDQFVKNIFLWLKHYNILETINEECQKGDTNIYKTVNHFLTKIINFKNIYKKLFNVEDRKLCKHIMFLYYLTFSLLHFKVKPQQTKKGIHYNKHKNNMFVQFCNSKNEVQKEEEGEEEEEENQHHLIHDEVNFSFLNINTSIFNYMYYYFFFKKDTMNIKFTTEKQEKIDKKKKENKINNNHEKITVTKHSSFIENLYKEAEAEKKKTCNDVSCEYKKKWGTNKWIYGYINKEALLQLFIDINQFIRKEKLKESTIDLFKYRNEYNHIFLSKKENIGMQISSFFYSLLNKIFIIYIYDFLQKNNLNFYRSVLLFDEHDMNILEDKKNILEAISSHIKNHKEFLKNHNYYQFKEENAKIISLHTYYETITKKLQYQFIISYFNNLVFILKSIKYYVDKSLHFVIARIFEKSFKNFIEILIYLFFKNQNMLLHSKMFYFIKETLFSYIIPYTFLFLSSIFDIDVTSSTEKLFKVLENYGIIL